MLDDTGERKGNGAVKFVNSFLKWPILVSLLKILIRLLDKRNTFCAISSMLASWRAEMGVRGVRAGSPRVGTAKKIASTLLGKQANNHKIIIGSRNM